MWVDFEKKEEEFSLEEIEANNKIYMARIEKYKSYNYDIIKERLFILNLAEPISGRILEVGTGKGHLTLEIARKGYSLVTYDIDEEVQRIAKMNVAYAGLSDRVNFIIGKKGKTIFKNKSFDIIFCVNTMHHIEEPGFVLEEFLRILADNGKIVLSDFTEKAFKIMDSIHKSEGKRHEVKGWTLNEAVEYLKNKGCDIVKKTADDYQSVFIMKRAIT